MTSAAVGIAVMLARPASAQATAEEPLSVRAFFDLGTQTFAASDTFDATFGSHWGTFVGGGGQVRWRWLLFEVSASRFERTGERVFVFENEVFRLGIPTTVSVRPVELTAAYRLPRVWRLVPYAGGGMGRHRYEETSEFATDDENLRFTTSSYHLVGGAEAQLWRWIGVVAEIRHRVVGDAIGKGGISRDFGESDLGGTSINLRISLQLVSW
jgi:opacity protein-like surface antigen